MDFPIDIKNKIELMAENYKISDLISSANKLSESYLNNDNKNNSFLTSNIDVISYAIMRMPATFGALSFSLSNLLDKIEQNITSILDVGSGTGSSILASNLLIKNDHQITCLERENIMMDFSKQLFNDPKIAYKKCDFVKEDPKLTADLVIASYFINEVATDELDNVINRLLEATNKYLLIVEPGTPVSFARMRKIREFFIDKGLNIVAPCPHNNKCPISSDDWCHFSTRVSRSRLHKQLKQADVPYEDEKFIYLAISKVPTNSSEPRVLRHPLIQNGLIKLKLCNKNGEIIDKIITKKDKEQFKIARKIKVGEEFL